MEDTGAALALPLAGPLRLAELGSEGSEEEDQEEEEEEDVVLAGFGGFAGSMDGASIAAPLSPPALRSLSDADGGVPPDKAGGVNMLTDEQRAAMLLLQDPVYRECAARLENLRAVHHKEKEALSKAKAAGATPSPSGVLREDVQGRRLQAQRLKRLEMLDSQLELALQNQRRYVLGRAGIAHLADGMVHLQGLGRLNESSAWVPPGGTVALDSPQRDSSLATTRGTELLTPVGFSELAHHNAPVPTKLKASVDALPATGAPRLGGATAAQGGDRRVDVPLPPPPLQPVADASSASFEQDSLSEHSPFAVNTASEIEAASFGAHMADELLRQLNPDDVSVGRVGGGMATAERDAMSAQLLDQLQRMEAQHLDSDAYDPRTCLQSVWHSRTVG